MLAYFHALIASFIHVSSTPCSPLAVRYLTASRLDLNAFFITTAVPSLRYLTIFLKSGVFVICLLYHASVC